MLSERIAKLDELIKASSATEDEKKALAESLKALILEIMARDFMRD